MYSAKRMAFLTLACLGIFLVVIGVLTENRELSLFYCFLGLPLFALGAIAYARSFLDL